MRLKGFHTMSCIFDILDLDEAIDGGIAHSVSREHCMGRGVPVTDHLASTPGVTSTRKLAAEMA